MRCFLLGAVLGTLLDGIHAYGDVLVYPDPAFGRWAWFVPLEFGLLGVGVGLLMPALERVVAAGRDAALVPGRAGGRARCCSPALYFATALVEPGGAVVLALALGALAVVRLLASARAPATGSTCSPPRCWARRREAIISALGAFDYVEPDFAGIPYLAAGAVGQRAAS